MSNLMTTDLSNKLNLTPSQKVWGVFLLCLTCSIVGVVLSFIVLGSTLTGVKQWGAGLAIAIIMLGISYGAKYANTNARQTFTPVDLIQYISQGFLWPSTWPALADFLGIQVIPPAPQAMISYGEVALELSKIIGHCTSLF